MARHREFDIDEALDTALQTFWRRGFEATSMDLLASEMGLKKGSIYRAFGNKESLFQKSLSKYLDTNFARFQDILKQHDQAESALRALLSELVDFSAQFEKPQGCFATNSLVELANRDQSVAKLLNQQRERLEKVYAELICKGQKEGEFRSDIDPQVASQFISTFIAGLMCDSKHMQGKERTEKMTELVTLLLRS